MKLFHQLTIFFPLKCLNDLFAILANALVHNLQEAHMTITCVFNILVIVEKKS